MGNPIFESLKNKQQQNSNPISFILGKMKEFKQNFSKNSNPEELIRGYLRQNNLSASQLDYVNSLAKQAVDAGIVSMDDYNKFNRLTGK